MAGVTVALNASELAGISQVIRGARPERLMLVVLVELTFVLNMGLFYASTFRASGVPAEFFRFTLVSAAAHFVNLVSKTSGFGGLGLYLREGSKHDSPAARVVAAYMAAYVLGYASFLALLLISLGLLYVHGSLTRTEVAAAAVTFAMVLTVSALLMAGLRSVAFLESVVSRTVAFLNSIIRRITGKPAVDAGGVLNWITEVAEAIQAMVRQPRRFTVPFVHALAVELLSALGLFLVAWSLHVPLSFDLAVCGYALSLLFAILSITPAGLGFVEASLVLFLASTGMTRTEAIAVTLGFRVFDFWLPVVIGAGSLLAVRGRREQPA